MSTEAEAPQSTGYQRVEVDIRGWVESSRQDPSLYQKRQVTEIALTAIGLSNTLNQQLVLKGGAVMALAFKSDRVTGDVDFSAIPEPKELEAILVGELNNHLPRAAIKLNYPSLICKVQSVKKLPKPLNFEEHQFPALLIKIGYATRGSKDEAKLAENRSTNTLELEISFRDQVYAFQELNLTEGMAAIRAFTIHELIAEKLRALIQQPIRNRSRRQDVYDISYLIETNQLSNVDLQEIHQTLLRKCETRGITPAADTMDDPEIASRAKSQWHTLALELAELPLFEECFEKMHSLYKSLPWDD
ncbi:nucleotidyl transferase AbiEii/AbiGii toxin family protein [Thalassospira xiamenensis]|uniref:Nucleotidyl transferase AbiEii toxin, Type IV TA system n=1 Tax=Thalassospira xiamenensis TaxID=220697 RepID=A0A285T2D8_9PROT|nr:nucleotidyl transferase AbiEii/AbiGii toxin family protein [Thalassospira xiamenensis]SOC15275.1 Nucleotidyl transferase AbiEii toxin, Type IV TA system [Thalassospira xiamenensis]